MTKSKSLPGGFPDVMTNPFAMSDAGARVQAFWTAQGAALEHMRSFVDSWYARRRDAAVSAADCCAHLMSDGGDLPAAARAWTEWASGAMERLRDDVQSQTTLATQIASEMTNALSTNGAAKPHRRKAHAEPASEGGGGARVRPSADIR